MNPLSPGYVAYESRFPRWLDWLTMQLDYAWFLALLGWSLVLVLWWWHPRRAKLSRSAWAWLPWSTVGGVLIAATEFVLFNGETSAPVKPGIDLVLAASALGVVAGWCGQATRGLGRRMRWLGWLGVAPLAAIAVLRDGDLYLGGWLMAGAALVALVPWWRRPGAGAWSRTALVLAALIPLASQFGPLGGVFHLYLRYVPQNAGSLGAGLFQALAAWIALAGLARDAAGALAPETRQTIAREARPFLIGAAVWVALTLTIGEATARRNIFSARHYTLEQIHRVLVQLDLATVEIALGADFKLDPASMPRLTDRSSVRLAFAPHLATGVGEPLARVLANVAAPTRGGLKAVSLVTLRDGWLVVALSSSRPGRPGQVRLARPATLEDQFYWEQRAEVSEGPISSGAGGFDFVRLPVTARDGAMLGWLEFGQARGTNEVPRFHGRAAPFVGAVLGLVVAALFFVQRHDLREREAALRAAAVAAEAARLKSDFLAKVSHELRTPLQSILGYGELLEPDVPGATGRARLAALRQNGEFMLRLVNDLLDLSAIEAGGFRFVEKPVALAALVRETIESLRPRFELKGLALVSHVADDFPAWVATDGERFRQIVLNLAGNALKFTERGRVDVALRMLDRIADGAIMIELAVRDTGPGIAPAEQAQLFQPFSRLELTAKKEGTGLGLALSAALCHNAGGNLTVESDGRTGACFRAWLRVKPAAAPAADAPRTDLFPLLRGRRILIADDNALVRDLFAAWLGELGALCETAGDGEQVLVLAVDRAFDAVILDLAMPRLDGLAAARRLRERGCVARIVGVSAHASGGDRVQALAAGMDAFLTKPVELAILAATLFAGEAPQLPASRHAQLRAQFAARFRGEVAGEAAAVREALTRRDWTEFHRRAHHLKGSAGVVGDERLYAACGKIEAAADARDAAAADAAWTECESALAPWLAAPPPA